MDDPSSTVLPAWFMTSIKAVKRRFFTTGEAVRCHFCGSKGHLVAQFPRRGYG
jgi:hypothetical protein